MLCRFVFPEPVGTVVWAAPGGGVERGETPEIADYRGSELFSPRDLATPLAALIADGVPARPVPLGL